MNNPWQGAASKQYTTEQINEVLKEELERLRQQVAELEKERDTFHMDYRMRCDLETKAAQARIAELREALSEYATDETPEGWTAIKAFSRTDNTSALNEYRNSVIDECLDMLENGNQSIASLKR